MSLNKVLYNIDQRAQTTDAEKKCVRDNIGAAAASEVPFTYIQRIDDTVTLDSNDISNGHFDINFKFANVVKNSDKHFLVALNVHIDENRSGNISAPDGTLLLIRLGSTNSGGGNTHQGESNTFYTKLGNTWVGRGNCVLLYKMSKIYNSDTFTLSVNFPPNTFQAGDVVSITVNAYLVSEHDLS